MRGTPKRTECLNGHPYDTIDHRGYRACSICTRARWGRSQKRYNARHPGRAKENYRKRYAADPEKFRKRNREKERRRYAQGKVKPPDPLKYGARLAVRNAVKDGRLVKPEMCESCGRTRRLHGHHDNYSKPLEVRWLCSWCHAAAHRSLVPVGEIVMKVEVGG